MAKTNAEDNELVRLLIVARNQPFKEAAMAMLKIGAVYGLQGMECLALLGSVILIPDQDFVVKFLHDNAGIDPFSIDPIPIDQIEQF